MLVRYEHVLSLFKIRSQLVISCLNDSVRPIFSDYVCVFEIFIFLQFVEKTSSQFVIV